MAMVNFFAQAEGMEEAFVKVLGTSEVANLYDRSARENGVTVSAAGASNFGGKYWLQSRHLYLRLRS